MKKIYVFLFNGFSDWEIAYLTPEIQKHTEFELIYFSKDGNSVLSMGGLKIMPDTSLRNVQINEAEMLILPGGKAWEQGGNIEITSLVKSLIKNKNPVAAICAATGFLARNGFLNNLKHTSNDIGYLKVAAPAYIGENHYINSPAISDNNIITASGISPIEFAREIFLKLQLFKNDDIEKWFQLFKNGIWQYTA